jgi:mono/diheme cytochrome c family protein
MTEKIMRVYLGIGLLVATSTIAAAQAPTTPSAPAAATGDVKHGKELFESNLRCYACHGYDGQTGSPRLVPMGRPQDAFVAYVRKPSGRGMPSFAATPERDLVDVYAYIRSIAPAAPAVDSLPLLKAIAERRAKAN